MAASKILLVEDDLNFGDVLKSYLEMHDFEVDWVTDGQQGLERFEKDAYALCILDVMMPRMDGFTLGQKIRETDGEIPMVYLTAKVLKEDVVKGLRIGADDYITKPFNPQELLLRIQNILKRVNAGKHEPPLSDHYDFGKFSFDVAERRLNFNHGEKVTRLTPKEAGLLQLLCAHLNEVMPRADALKKIWGDDNYYTARSMDVFITRLRKLLKDDPNLEIVNIHGSGFKLVDRSSERQDQVH